MTKEKPNPRFFSIRWKLLSATFISATLALLIAMAGLYCMHLLHQRLKEVVGIAAERVKVTNLLQQDLGDVFRAERNMMLVSDQKEYDRIATDMEPRFESINAHVKKLRTLFAEESESQLNQFVEDFESWKINHQLVRQHSGLDSQRRARELSMRTGEVRFNQFETAIDQIISTVVTSPSSSGHSTDPSDASDGTPSNPTDQSDQINISSESKLEVLGELLRDALKLQRVEKNLILQASLATLQDPEETIQPFQEQVQGRIERLKMLLSDHEMELLDEAIPRLNAYLDVNRQIVEVVQQKGNVFGFQLVRDTGLPLAKSCVVAANSMLNQSEVSLGEYERESSSLYKTFRNSLLILSLIAVATTVLISMSIGGRVANNVRQLSEYASQVYRAKDLTRPVPQVGNDETRELADAFEDMRVALLSQNSKLARLNETLEDKNEEMEQFVYSVSHDLKSPLVSCKGLVGLINEDIEDEEFEEVKNSAARLSTVTDQMNDTIDDLLTFSRLGHNPLEQEEVDVQELLQRLKNEWEDRLSNDQVKLLLSENLHPIFADPIGLQRVFDNLIGNAVKYAGDEAQSQISIGSEKHGRRIRYFVRDNGPGIAEEYHEKIFKLFQRLDTSKSGTGIGLASVAKIVRQHRGKVWVESKLGSGATFWIELPNTNPNAHHYIDRQEP